MMHLAAFLLLLAAPAARVEPVAADAKLVEPFGVARDRSGAVYICEHKGQRITRVDRRGAISAFAGVGAPGTADFKDPHGLVLGPDRQMYVADTLNHRVLRIDLRTGKHSVIAGTGAPGFSGDGGPADKAAFNGTFAIDLDRKGTGLYVVDLQNKRVRLVDLKSGTIRTVAGNGTQGIPEDGADAASSPLADPRAVAVDSKGNVYILERRGNALRVLDRAGKIRTLIGPGKGALTMNGPKHLCVDRKDDVIIADAENHRVLKYTPRNGAVVVIAGTGQKGDRIDPEEPLKTELNRPHGVYVDRSGDLYVSDSYNHRILKIRLGP